jgi:Domain of unknown function (DUF4430)
VPRRGLSALLVAVLALVLAAPAFGIRVHVRVEGAHATIYGATEPLLTPYEGALPVEGGTELTLTQPTALGALEAGSIAGEFYYRLIQSSFGAYVDRIGRNLAAGASGWAYKVNGVSPQVGADASVVKEGDEVLWYWATFGEAGGPPTLDLVASGKSCYRAFSVDDAGARTRATGVVFLLDGAKRRSASGRICPSGDWHELRATKNGAIRSQVVVG